MSILESYEKAKGDNEASKEANILGGILSGDTGALLAALPTSGEKLTGVAVKAELSRLNLDYIQMTADIQVDKILLSGATPAERGVELAMLERIKATSTAADLVNQIFVIIDKQLKPDVIRITDGASISKDLGWMKEHKPDFYACGIKGWEVLSGYSGFNSTDRTLNDKPILVIGGKTDGTEILDSSLYGIKTGVLSGLWIAEDHPIEIDYDKATEVPSYLCTYVEYTFCPVVSGGVCRLDITAP